MRLKRAVLLGFTLVIALLTLWALRLRLRDVALGRAVTANDSAEVRRLLAVGANPNTQATFCGRMTALQAASGNSSYQIVKLLLDFGAAVNAQDDGHHTALWWAVLNGHLDVARLLIAHGADVWHRTPVGINDENSNKITLWETPRAMITRVSQHTPAAVKKYHRQRRPVFTQIIQLLKDAEARQQTQQDRDSQSLERLKTIKEKSYSIKKTPDDR